QPTWSSSKRGLEVVTGERLEIERLTSRSEEGRWKSTHRGNSLAAYPTACPCGWELGGMPLLRGSMDAVLRPIFWSLPRARRSTLRPRVAADNQPCDLVSQR